MFIKGTATYVSEMANNIKRAWQSIMKGMPWQSKRHSSLTSKHANNEKLEEVPSTQSLKAPSLDSTSEEYPDLLPVGGPPPVLLAPLLRTACFSHVTVRACMTSTDDEEMSLGWQHVCFKFQSRHVHEKEPGD